LRIP
jgi:hypothetical protein